MSFNQIQLCSRIIGETFGDVVDTVATSLAGQGALTLRSIIRNNSSLKPNQIKKSLSVLILHNIVTCNYSSNDAASPVVYTLNISAVIRRNRFPYYIFSSKQMFGSEAELITEEILRHGQVNTSTLLTTVADRLKDEAQEDQKHLITVRSVFEKFSALVRSQFIRRCPDLIPASLSDGSSVVAVTPLPSFVELKEENAYDLPRVNFGDLERSRKRKLDESEGEPAAKRALLNNGEECATDTKEGGSELDVLWRVNMERFDEHIRDKHIISAISRRYGKNAAEIVRVILRANDSGVKIRSNIESNLSFNEIVSGLPPEMEISRAVADQWLKILIDTAPQFITRKNDSGGGIYGIDFKSSYRELCIHHIESVLQERFGGKAKRVFRLLLEKERLEEKQVLELTMISDKGLLRRLLDEQFLTLTEIARAMDYNPHKTIYLFSVDLNHVTRIVLQKCYKAVANLINRRCTLKQEHEGLLTQEQRVDAIIAQYGYDETLRREAEEMMSAEEKDQLSKFKAMTKKLEHAELQLDSTISVLETYLAFTHTKLPAKKSNT